PAADLEQPPGRTQFLMERDDAVGDGAGGVRAAPRPDGARQLARRQHPARGGGQGIENRVLPVGYLDFRAGDQDPSNRPVEGQRPASDGSAPTRPSDLVDQGRNPPGGFGGGNAPWKPVVRASP